MAIAQTELMYTKMMFRFRCTKTVSLFIVLQDDNEFLVCIKNITMPFLYCIVKI